MNKHINFLKKCPTIDRDLDARLKDKAGYRDVSLQFGEMYFDGPREYGYGGYYYDGRWVPIAESIVDQYNLKAGDKVLDVGCAKGFLVRDLLKVCPGLEVFGLDISRYAIKNCHPDVVGRVHLGNAVSLPFPDSSFDVVLSINTIHNLEIDECIKSLKEIERVSIRHSFVQVDAYRNGLELELFEKWMLTAKSYFLPSKWLEVFVSAGYTGDYDWTIIDAGS